MFEENTMKRRIINLQYGLCLLAVLGLSTAIACSTSPDEEDEVPVEQPELTEIEKAHEATGLAIEALEAWERGVQLEADGDLNAAVEYYELAVQEEPTFAEAHYNLGMVLGELDQPDQALEHIQAARDLDPDVFDYMVAEAKASAEAGEYEDARRLFNEVISRQPDNLTAINNLAIISLREGDEQQALEYVEEILREDNDHVGALNTLGLIYMERENISLAQYVLQRALEEDETNSDVHNNLALVYLQDGDVPNAINHFDLAVEHDPNYLESRMNRATILIEYLDYDRVFEDYEYTVELAPENCEANLGFAAANYAQRDYERARDLFEFYVEECDENHFSSFRRLADLNEGPLQDPEGAIAAYQRLIELEDDEDEIVQYEAEITFLENQMERMQEQEAEQVQPQEEEDAAGDDPADAAEDQPSDDTEEQSEQESAQ